MTVTTFHKQIGLLEVRGTTTGKKGGDSSEHHLEIGGNPLIMDFLVRYDRYMLTAYGDMEGEALYEACKCFTQAWEHAQTL